MLAGALTRGVILALPVTLPVGLWAGRHLIAERVAAAPAVTSLQRSHTDLAAELARAREAAAAQADRLRELEEAKRTADAGLRAAIAQLDRIEARQASQSNQINRLVGAFEARGIIPPRPLADLSTP